MHPCGPSPSVVARGRPPSEQAKSVARGIRSSRTPTEDSDPDAHRPTL